MSSNMKEPNAIKLFIGQIPHDYNEKDLTELFEPYGDIYRLDLLQDRSAGHHKGCAFLTYYDNDSAKSAQAELHESRTLPGARNPIQVKPANSEENVEDRTLYVGMLSKKLMEGDVRDMFAPFGGIENLHLLKNPDGRPRGCAFIKYETKLQAQNAIKAMNNSETMEGCTYPLVVKIADTDKDKQSKRVVPNHQSPSAATAMISAAGGGVQQVAYLPQSSAYLPQNSAYLQQNSAYQQLLASQVGGVPQIIGGGQPIYSVLPNGQLALIQPQIQFSNPNALSTSAAGNLQLLGFGGGGVVGYPADATANGASTSIQSYIPGYPQAYIAPQASSTSVQSHRQSSSSSRRDTEGNNLFIYHLPQDFNDSDLLQSFSPFGEVISAKVYIDKATGLSKCFGFVKYNSSSSALSAIKAMNGASIGSKRLKVQLKKPRDQDKPY